MTECDLQTLDEKLFRTHRLVGWWGSLADKLTDAGISNSSSNAPRAAGISQDVPRIFWVQGRLLGESICDLNERAKELYEATRNAWKADLVSAVCQLNKDYVYDKSANDDLQSRLHRIAYTARCLCDDGTRFFRMQRTEEQLWKMLEGMGKLMDEWPLPWVWRDHFKSSYDKSQRTSTARTASPGKHSGAHSANVDTPRNPDDAMAAQRRWLEDNSKVDPTFCGLWRPLVTPKLADKAALGSNPPHPLAYYAALGAGVFHHWTLSVRLYDHCEHSQSNIEMAFVEIGKICAKRELRHFSRIAPIKVDDFKGDPHNQACAAVARGDLPAAARILKLDTLAGSEDSRKAELARALFWSLRDPDLHALRESKHCPSFLPDLRSCWDSAAASPEMVMRILVPGTKES